MLTTNYTAGPSAPLLASTMHAEVTNTKVDDPTSYRMTSTLGLFKGRLSLYMFNIATIKYLYITQKFFPMPEHFKLMAQLIIYILEGRSDLIEETLINHEPVSENVIFVARYCANLVSPFEQRLLMPDIMEIYLETCSKEKYDKILTLAVYEGDYELVKKLLTEPKYHTISNQAKSEAFTFINTIDGDFVLTYLDLANESLTPESIGVVFARLSFYDSNAALLMLQHPLAKKIPIEDMRVALVNAAENSYVDLVMAILKHKNKENVFSSKCITLSLLKAAKYGYIHIVQALLPYTNDFTTKILVLRVAFKHNHYHVIDSILADLDPSIADEIKKNRTSSFFVALYRRSRLELSKAFYNMMPWDDYADRMNPEVKNKIIEQYHIVCQNRDLLDKCKEALKTEDLDEIKILSQSKLLSSEDRTYLFLKAVASSNTRIVEHMLNNPAFAHLDSNTLSLALVDSTLFVRPAIVRALLKHNSKTSLIPQKIIDTAEDFSENLQTTDTNFQLLPLVTDLRTERQVEAVEQQSRELRFTDKRFHKIIADGIFDRLEIKKEEKLNPKRKYTWLKF